MRQAVGQATVDGKRHGKGALLVALVQRDEQFARLREAYLTCKEQQSGQVALVTGAVGSGKTTLLEAFQKWATDDGGQVLRAACSLAERNLTFGVFDQLFHSARLHDDARRHVEQLMRDPAFAGPLPEPGDETPEHLRADEHARAPVMQGLFTSLLELARSNPLVLAVDDVHYADVASLHCLLYVVRRLRYAQIMIVLTESSRLRSPHPLFRAELFSQPYFSRITLRSLSAEGVARLAGTDLDPVNARQVSERCLTVTGGNPMLSRALLDAGALDLSNIDDPTSPDGGTTFDQAVLGCLYRHEPGVRRVAQALTVLNRPATPELLGQLLDVVPEFVSQALRILHMSGLVEANQLRHPRIRRSILADLSPDDRHELHRRAAEVLHDHGAEPTAVAEHLIASGWADDPWALPVLQEAAGHALAVGQPDFATSCLRLIGRAAMDNDQRRLINAMLVTARWQINPLAAKSHLNDLVATARAEGWTIRTASSAVPCLLWYGRTEEAVAAVSAVAGNEPASTTTATGARIRALQLLVSLTYPDCLSEVRENPGTWARAASASLALSPQLQAVTLLAAALMPTPENDVATTAEQIIQRYHPEDGALGLLIPPLLATLYTGHADRVVNWADRLLDRPGARHAPTWRAILHAIRGEAALRLGDLSSAEHHAQTAIEDMSPQAWGVAIAGPLATLISCATEAGRPNDAERWLAHPVPAGAFRTLVGLHYLAARAQHHLTSGRHHAAISDLRKCGELMRDWGFDVAGLVPWRLELARVQLVLGHKVQATQLLQEQLRMPQGVDDRTRGRVLRLLATVSPPDQRRKLLSEAVNLLQSCGDKLELARALGDTGQALQRIGESARARLVVRRGYQLAQDCGSVALAQQLLRREPGAVLTQWSGTTGEEPDDGLSEAERRVAALAAQGHTNRQISARLYITVSTVEQHLTRVYRKLGVKRRTDLPARLIAYAEPARENASAGAS